MREEKLAAPIQESQSVATRSHAIQPSELSRVIVDTTVQPKNALLHRSHASESGPRDAGPTSVSSDVIHR
jgi:hypothetical protein